MCLSQGHKTVVASVRLEPPASRSRTSTLPLSPQTTIKDVQVTNTIKDVQVTTQLKMYK